MKSGKLLFILITLAAVILTAGCVEPGMEIASSSFPPAELPPVGSSLTPYTVDGDSFTLAWNPSESEDLLGYNVYYRPHETETWLFLIDSDEAQLEVTSAMLPGGDYEFAVSSYTATEESDLHTSLDETANPDTGWYLVWNQV
ncbi:fibronectin type III domain-containing protein [Marispirochaeta aestuarii]|uniref:fibronectin type III domain-containing protein n=1 Tax=Marispirochaeta aestuarii TaxID=1963862 RepID=UPI0029C7EC87|nr:fibronectin type III domain-containing protein [Marispirochaeta aestuarii]